MDLIFQIDDSFLDEYNKINFAFYKQIVNLMDLLFETPGCRRGESKRQSLRFIWLIDFQSKYLAFFSQIFSHFFA